MLIQSELNTITDNLRAYGDSAERAADTTTKLLGAVKHGMGLNEDEEKQYADFLRLLAERSSPVSESEVKAIFGSSNFNALGSFTGFATFFVSATKGGQYEITEKGRKYLSRL